MKTLKEHASESLEADLLESEEELGLTQARIQATGVTSWHFDLRRPPTKQHVRGQMAIALGACVVVRRCSVAEANLFRRVSTGHAHKMPSWVEW